MKRLIPTLLFSALAASFGAQAATPKDTLVVVSSLEGIISLYPAEFRRCRALSRQQLCPA
ncbi:exported hypothetical protein [Serratia proteamaculans]|uniref:hypothetical protein n=1 Tax=Serratia proteamaculans TaxID=28151 RepID=UPI0009F7C1E0|nr:hypothetical protein [Serratia proteamaculans]SMB39276.1 exported hypothetical protein [Serratia proteamaculans]